MQTFYMCNINFEIKIMFARLASFVFLCSAHICSSVGSKARQSFSTHQDIDQLVIHDITRRVKELELLHDHENYHDVPNRQEDTSETLLKMALLTSTNLQFQLETINFTYMHKIENLVEYIYRQVKGFITNDLQLTFVKFGLTPSEIETLLLLGNPSREKFKIEIYDHCPQVKNNNRNNSSTDDECNGCTTISENAKEQIQKRFSEQVNFGLAVTGNSVSCSTSRKILASRKTSFVRVTDSLPRLYYIYEDFLTDLNEILEMYQPEIQLYNNKCQLYFALSTKDRNAVDELVLAELLFRWKKNNEWEGNLRKTTVLDTNFLVSVINYDYGIREFRVIREKVSVSQKNSQIWSSFANQRFSDILFENPKIDVNQNSSSLGIFGVHFEELLIRQRKEEFQNLFLEMASTKFQTITMTYTVFQNHSHNLNFQYPVNIFILMFDWVPQIELGLAIESIKNFTVQNEQNVISKTKVAGIIFGFQGFAMSTSKRILLAQAVKSLENTTIQFGLHFKMENQRELKEEQMVEWIKFVSGRCKTIFKKRCAFLFWGLTIPEIVSIADKSRYILKNMAPLRIVESRLGNQSRPNPDIVLQLRWIKDVVASNEGNLVYCNEIQEVSRNALKGMAIVARATRISTIISDVFENDHMYGWFKTLGVEIKQNEDWCKAEINRKYIFHHTFCHKVPFGSNPEWKAESQHFVNQFDLEPCISWEKNGPTIKIPFVETLTGITVTVPFHFQSFSKFQDSYIDEGIKIMMRFAIQKFNNLELIFKYPDGLLMQKKIEDLNNKLHLLNSLPEKSGNLAVFINFQKSNFSQTSVNSDGHSIGRNDTSILLAALSEIQAELQNITLHATFHFDSSSHKIFHSSFMNVYVKIGLLIYNCGEMSYREGDFSNEEKNVLEKADYVICNIELPNYQSLTGNVVDRFFRILLLIRHIFRQNFPNLATIFRIQSFFILDPLMEISEKEDRNMTLKFKSNHNKYFLRFWNEFNKFAITNRIKYFIHQGFDLPTESTNLIENHFEASTWWTVSNFSDFTNASVYTERESEYFNKETSRPLDDEIDKHFNPNNWTMSYIIGALIALLIIVLVGSVISISMIFRRNLVVLSSDEMLKFLEGSPETSEEAKEEILDLPGISKFLRQKYDKEVFEISKKAIDFGNKILLGNGQFGTVYKVNLKGQPVALKMPRSSRKENVKSILREIKIMTGLGDHESLLGFVGAYTEEIQRGIVYLVTEVCENGSLETYLRSLGRDSVNKYELLRFGQEIASGMEFISEKPVVHGDLATRNVLLDGNLRCKISDFGLARKIYDVCGKKQSDGDGDDEMEELVPWRWMALETLTLNEYSVKSDVWSFGVTLWEIFSLGEIPYGATSYTENFVASLRNGECLKIPSQATEDVFAQMKTCWNQDPKLRPDFSQLKEFFLSLRSTAYDNIN